MPIFKELAFKFHHIVIWKIDESKSTLEKGLKLHPSDREKFNQLKNPFRKCEFLALRQCLRYLYGENPEVYYHSSGKPYLKRNCHLSFSHSQQFAALIVSDKMPVGIDLESFRERIVKIKDKFLRPEERRSLHPGKTLEHLTAYWCAKEVIVKIEGNRRLDFREEIRVEPFAYADYQSTQAHLAGKDQHPKYQLYFQNYGDFLLSYGWAKP